MKIKRIKHQEIDFDAYNHCVESSPFGTVYAMSWYLDAVSPQWEVLMADNYRYVMPLPVKKKMGISYLTQPYFCQQLGIFSTEPISLNIYNQLVKAIPYFFYRIQLNPGNRFDGFHTQLRDNFELNLNRPYSEIRENYGQNFDRNIKKSKKIRLYIDKKTKLDTFFEIVKNNAGERPIQNLLPLFKEMIMKIQEKVSIEIQCVKDESDSVLSAALFLRWRKRIYYLLPVSTPEGKATQSMSFLLDQLIQEYAEQALILDFEGSSIPNVARFYQGTGAVKTSYPLIKRIGFM